MIVFDKLWETMKEKQISTYYLREHHGFDGGFFSRLRRNENTTTETLNRLCKVLDCKLEDIAEYIPDKED